ncbi:hypothetical protein DFQ10_11085 [Winogradskyella eximia]|uniref:FUSC family protein n=1 Tax=Winogradskyella eximia TaxID=262006 RepID=A0A3D9GRE9_9FLAO|nr:FUSC family protein [Winogradskyella eximia]RED38578.1 hypothetical protein DFQ10_11085 [Winogradskyella eximia]
MKKFFSILGFISAIIATILAVSKFSNLAVAPIIIAFISGLLVLFYSKKEQTKTKTIQYIFLLVIISLSLTIYKAVINTSNLDDSLIKDDIEQTELKEEDNLEDSENLFNNKGSDDKF